MPPEGALDVAGVLGLLSQDKNQEDNLGSQERRYDIVRTNRFWDWKDWGLNPLLHHYHRNDLGGVTQPLNVNSFLKKS